MPLRQRACGFEFVFPELSNLATRMDLPHTIEWSEIVCSHLPG
jgi:hypothetical protein